MTHAISIDLGGTQIRAAMVDESGTIKNRVAHPTPATAGPEAVVAAMAKAASEAAVGVDAKSILGVGASAPGPMDTKRGVSFDIATLNGFADYPLRNALAEKLERPVWLENDGIAAAIGEWKFGSGKGHASVVYVTASTGIGGGVIVDGQVLRGRMGLAGHVGHLCIDRNGIRCGCGNTGCWEAYAAGPAFAARAQKAVTPASSLAGCGSIQPADVFKAAAEGDALAITLVAEEARLLGTGMTSLLHLYSPDVLVLGGGLSSSFDQLHPGITAYIADNAMAAFRDVPVVKAALGGNSGLVGAAALVFAGHAQ